MSTSSQSIIMERASSLVRIETIEELGPSRASSSATATGRPVSSLSDQGWSTEPGRMTLPRSTSSRLSTIRPMTTTISTIALQSGTTRVVIALLQSQRKATIEAGTKAGLNVIRIINETSAAAIAYGFERGVINQGGEWNILVVDLGGGSSHVSIIKCDEGWMDVISTTGDTNLGGINFDNRMVDYFAEEFKDKNEQRDIKRNKEGLGRLRSVCEEAKIKLSKGREVQIEIDSLIDGIPFSTQITREKFQELNADLFSKILKFVEQALIYAKMDKFEIHEVVLMGGCSNIPKIQEMLQDFFNGKELNKSINTDEAIAYGAAVIAAILTGDESQALKKILLIDSIPLSLGIETNGGDMARIIPRNTNIPTKNTQTFTNCSDNQTDMYLLVYRGEGELTKDNELLGIFKLSGIQPHKKGRAEIEITLDIDVMGIWSVEAEEVISGKKKKIKIKETRMSKKDIERMGDEAEKYRIGKYKS